MTRKVLALALLLGLVAALVLWIVDRPPIDDRIGEICVAPAPTGGEPRLEPGAEVYLYVRLLDSEGECVSSTSLSRRPVTEPLGPRGWRVSGGFVDAPPDQPRTPDCDGGTVVSILGRLSAGSYEIESSLGALPFEIPSSDERICASRR